MTKFFKSKEQLNIVVFLTIAIFICVILYVRQNIIIDKCAKIIIGSISKISFSNDSSIRDVFFEIRFNNNEYSIKRGNGEKYIPQVGERFFLKIACENPNMGEAYWNIKIPDTLQNIPVNGWDKVPYGLDKSK